MVTSPGIRALMAPGWVRDPLWTRAQRVPSLDLRFAANRSLRDHVSGAELVTFTRASSATVIGPTGAIETVADNVPRFQHDPTTGQCLGLLVEEQRVSLLLNSATLSTQSVTTAATAYTLSFYGTGTITLSGTSTAGPLVGTGASSRVSLTFTPTAGTLTLTVSGSVTNANLEAGSFATSWIPTTGTSATRSADVVTISGSNFSQWYNAAAQTWYSGASSSSGAAYSGYVYAVGPDFNNSIQHYRQADFQPVARVRTASADQYGATGNGAVWTGTSANKFALALSPTSGRQASNGALDTAGDDLSVTLPSATSMSIGSLTGSLQFNGTISRLTYWPARLSNATLQALTR